jgi:hypothetical protein
MFRDMRNLTKQANELKKSSNTPGMGEMIKQASEQVSQLNEMQQGTPELIASGEPGTGIVKGMGTPARGAQWFNIDIDLEVHVTFREPYRVTNDYLVPSWAGLGPGVELPIKVDKQDPARIAIDWDQLQKPAARGEIRPA